MVKSASVVILSGKTPYNVQYCSPEVMVTDELMTFSQDNPIPEDQPKDTWQILIVDDDQDVHSVTELVMHGVQILGKGLTFHHAYRVSEAITILTEMPNISVILLDVVMESENAGFQLIRHVREIMKLQSVRIILRTGQPGYAPEFEAIRDYDINDYRTKSELSYARFLTSLTSALRSYVQITQISANSELLTFILQSAPGLLATDSLDSFVTSVVSLLQGSIRVPFEFSILHHPVNTLEDSLVGPPPVVLHATGELAPSLGMAVDFSSTTLPPGLTLKELDYLRQSFESHGNILTENTFVILLPGIHQGDLYLMVKTKQPVGSEIQNSIEIAGFTASMGYQNLNLLLQLRDLAFRDNITGMLNRTGIINEIDRVRSLGLARQTLVLVDIEGFSELNEALGHHYGDAILKAVGRRLSSCFDNTVLCARVGGDAFVLLGKEDTILPELLMEVFSRPFMINQYSMYLRMVSGFVRLDEVMGDGADLLKDAYLAVKTAKSQKQTRYAYYNPRVEAENRSRVLLLEELQRAINTEFLMVYYQPQVEMKHGSITGLEALLRWKRQDGTFIPPSTFIPLAEQSGLIVDIGDWLIQEVFRQKSLWNAQGLGDFRVAINVSVRQFYNPGFIYFLRTSMEIHGIQPSEVEVEITESLAMNSIDEVVSLLSKLKDLGVKIALDDFGTGFSSLSYLQRLPIDRIKIDQAFVSTIHEHKKQRTIAQTIVRMGQSLGLELIAEGVEQDVQRSILLDLGCPEAQGYFYGKPMDHEASSQWIKKNNLGSP